MIMIREAKKKGAMEILVDEYESFKEMGVMTIPLNDFYQYKKDIDSGEHIYIKAPTAFYSCIKSLQKNDEVLEHATENIRQVVNEKEGINEYSLDSNGTKELYKELHQYAESVSVKYDCGRRKPQKIHKSIELCFIVCDKIEQYKIKKDYIEDGLKNNFKDLLLKNEYIAVVTQVIKVSDKYLEDFDINIWGKELGTPEALTQWCRKEISKEQFIEFKGRLYEGAKDCYIKFLALSIKSILDSFNCPKYYLTANIIKDNKLAIDTTLAYQSSKSIKNIDVAIINRVRSNDISIIENLDLLENQDFKCLSFLSLAKSIKKIINQKVDVKTDHVVIKSVVNDGEKSVNVDTRSSEDIDDNITKTCTLTYVNGTESQGRNYSKSELLIVNGTIDINVKGRLTKNEDGEIIIKTIEVAAAEKLLQVFGRIYRGDQIYKAMLVLGDYENIKEVFQLYSDKYSIKFNIEQYNKQIERRTQLRRALSDIIEYFGSKFAASNGGNREQRDVQHFNSDLRGKTASNEKFDGEAIYKYYCETIETYYDLNNRKPKEKEIRPEILEKFEISKSQFERIIKKYK
jgi:hypothetical protein